MSVRRKVSTTIYLEAAQAERLKVVHERTRIPIAEFIRQGADMVLDVYEPLLGIRASQHALAAPAVLDQAQVRGRREEVIAATRAQATEPARVEEDIE